MNLEPRARPELKMDHLRMVPDFGGEVELLSEFIKISESLVNHFYNTDNVDDFQNIFLMNSLKQKIKGEARINLSTYNINNWQELKQALLSTYEDKRDCYTLTLEMCGLKQLSESPFQFHAQIQKLVNLHSAYLDTHSMSGESEIKNYISKLAIRTFLRGLKEPLGSLMRTKDPKDLNEALNILTNEFQIDAVKKTFPTNNFQNNTLSKKPAVQPFKKPPSQHNYNNQQNYTNAGYANFHNPNRFNNFSKPFSPSNNFVNNRPFQASTNNFVQRPTNNFNNVPNRTTPQRPANVWNRTPVPQTRPTPMSGVQTIRNHNIEFKNEDQPQYEQDLSQYENPEHYPEEESNFQPCDPNNHNYQEPDPEVENANFCINALEQ